MPTGRFDQAEALAAIGEAPFVGTWTSALAHLTRAGGGWCGQLVGVASSGGLMFDVVEGLPTETLSEWEAAGGADPSLNPRAQILRRNTFEVLGDDDCLAPEARSRNAFYAELYEPVDGPYACLARLPAPGGSIGVAVMRSQLAGHAGRQDLNQFASVLPQLAGAIRLDAALQQQGVHLALGALGAMRAPAVLLDSAGKVVALTGAAETRLGLAARAPGLHVVRGRLEATHRPSDARLQAAIRRACAKPFAGHPPPPAKAVLIESPEGPMVAEVSALPRSSEALHFGPVAVVVLPQLRPQTEDRLEVLRAAFRFSPAEAEIALAMAASKSPPQIAAVRGVSVATVRHQVKSVFAKAGVNSQLALAWAVTRLIGPVL